MRTRDVDTRLQNMALGLAEYLSGKKDKPRDDEQMLLDFLGDVLPVMLDKGISDRHMKLRKTCLDFSLMWLEARQK